MQTVRIVLSILICVILLGACGLKGPLYLPQDEPASEAATAVETGSPAEEGEEQEETRKEKSLDDQNGR